MSEYTDKGTYFALSLLFEIIVFYFSIFSMMIFLVFTRFFSFRTIREQMGYGGNLRYKMDFLEYCKDDIHWVLIYTTELMLMI